MEAVNSDGWESLRVDSDYEINTTFPYPIRKLLTNKIVSESVRNDGYVQCRVGHKQYLKHRIVATQWLDNPNPTELTDVDHINQNRSDNRLENLRWVTKSENQRNRSRVNNVTYTYIDELPEETQALESYGRHELDNYFINFELKKLYVYNGVRYRELVPVRAGTVCYTAVDIEGKKIKLCHNVLF